MLARSRSAAPLAFVIAAAALVVALQPVTSPWWIYADADGTYSASALNIISGGHSRYFDHPGLPEQELLAITFGAISLPSGGPTQKWAFDEMLHLDRARPVFRGWAIAFFVGGAALAYLLVRRLFGHWTWGVSGGLLWLAMPDLTDTLQIRPDVLLSGLMLTTGFLVVRGWERRSTALYVLAAAVAGFALMTKLHSVAILPALLLATVLRRPGANWWPKLVADARSFIGRHRVGVGVGAGIWLALFVLLNWGRYTITVTNLHPGLLLVGVAAVAAYVAGTWIAAQEGTRRIVRRIFDPFYVALGAAYAVGVAVPLLLVLSDSPRVLLDTFETIVGRNINAGVVPFQLSTTDFTTFPLLEVMILIAVATVAAAVGLARRDAWPVLWFVAAATTTLFAVLRLGEARYFAPGFVLAIPAALWLFRRRSTPVASPLVWLLVAVVVIPTFLHATDAASAAHRDEAQARAITQLADRYLKPGEVALVSSYAYPDADARWWGLVQSFVTAAPAYPYRVLPDEPAALQTAANEHKHVAYYFGPVALGMTKRGPITLGSGTYEAVPLQLAPRFRAVEVAAVKLVSGPGT